MSSDSDSDMPSLQSTDESEEEEQKSESSDSNDGMPVLRSDSDDDDDESKGKSDSDGDMPDLKSEGSSDDSGNDVPELTSDSGSSDYEEETTTSNTTKIPKKAAGVKKPKKTSKTVELTQKEKEEKAQKDAAYELEKQERKKKRKEESRQKKASEKKEAERAKVAPVRYGPEIEERATDTVIVEEKKVIIDYDCAACNKTVKNYDKYALLNCSNEVPCNHYYHAHCWKEKQTQKKLAKKLCWGDNCTYVLQVVTIMLNGKIESKRNLIHDTTEEGETTQQKPAKKEKTKSVEQSSTDALSKQKERSVETKATATITEVKTAPAEPVESPPRVVKVDYIEAFPMNPKPHYSRGKKDGTSVKKEKPKKKKVKEPTAPIQPEKPALEEVPENGYWTKAQKIVMDNAPADQSLVPEEVEEQENNTPNKKDVKPRRKKPSDKKKFVPFEGYDADNDNPTAWGVHQQKVEEAEPIKAKVVPNVNHPPTEEDLENALLVERYGTSVL